MWQFVCLEEYKLAKSKMAKSKKSNVIRYEEKRKFNVGFFVFVIILVYIIGHTIFFMLREKTSIYRVVSDEKTEVINTTGLALRKEKTVKSEEAGYINYYVNGNSRVRKDEVVFSIDKTGSIYSKLTAKEQGDEAEDRMTGIIHQFQINRDDNFLSTYSLKESMNETVMTTSGKMVLATLKDNIDTNGSFSVNYASDSGIVVYGADGLEGITEDKITSDIFEKQNSYVLKTATGSEGKVNSGDIIYKLISDEIWNVVVPINDIQKELLKERNYVDVIVDNKGFTAKAYARVDEVNGSNYLFLTFYNYMVDYADKRFVNIYIVLKSVSGLKVPRSSVVERQVFEIPDEYYVGGGGNKSGGFTLRTVGKKDKVETDYLETNICYRDTKKKMVYVDINEGIKSGDVLMAPNSENTYTVSSTKLLKGVYNINKGYPIFRHVEPDTENVVSDSSEYYLIPTNKGYFLNEYDNIILNADKMDKE